MRPERYRSIAMMVAALCGLWLAGPLHAGAYDDMLTAMKQNDVPQVIY